MPLYNFSEVKSQFPFRCSFIKQATLWRHNRLNIKLSVCNYDIAHYSHTLFKKYHIRLPLEIERSLPKRQAEFLAGRIVAKHALSHLAEPLTSVDIPIAKNRTPSWPQGYTGSISHTSNVAVAIVGNIERVESLGIDIENYFDETVSDTIANQVCNNDEANTLAMAGLCKRDCMTLIFSAKETLFKALYKSVNEYFGFDCARIVSIDIDKKVLTLLVEENFRTRHQLNVVYQVEFIFLNSSVYTFMVL